MDTNELVTQLAGELKPVKPLSSAALCVLCWGFAAAALVSLAVMLLGGVRPDVAGAMQRPAFLLENAAMLVSGALAAFAAFRLRVPQPALPRPVLAALGAASAIWLFEIVRCALNAQGLDGHLHAQSPYLVHPCMVELAAMMLAPGAMLVFLLRRGATTQALWAGYAALLAAAAISAIGMRYYCPLDDAGHLLLWHFLPVAVYALLGSLAGRFFLKW